VRTGRPNLVSVVPPFFRVFPDSAKQEQQVVEKGLTRRIQRSILWEWWRRRGDRGWGRKRDQTWLRPFFLSDLPRFRAPSFSKNRTGVLSLPTLLPRRSNVAPFPKMDSRSHNSPIQSSRLCTPTQQVLLIPLISPSSSLDPTTKRFWL